MVLKKGSGEVHETAACLRFFGQNLDLEHLTRVLGCAPTKSWRTADASLEVEGVVQLRPTKGWMLTCEPFPSEDLNEQVMRLLKRLNPDLHVWRRLTSQYRADIFCGVFLKDTTGLSAWSNQTLSMISDRGLNLNIQIYEKDG